MLETALADALYMDLLGLAQFATVLTLGNRTAFLLDFKQGTVKVLARGGSMTLYAGFTSVFFAADDHGWRLPASDGALDLGY